MFESGNVTYIPWEKCTKRDSEILSRDDAKLDRAWKPDAQGCIREVSAAITPKLEVGSDLLLRYALQRRGLALEIAGVCDFHTHELWVQVLMDALMNQAPPGYAKINWNQMRNADKELWKVIARACRAGLRWSTGETPPFDKALKVAIFDPSVRLLLMPLPALPSAPASGSSSSAVAGLPANANQRTKLSRGQKRQLRLLQQSAQVPVQQQQSNGPTAPPPAKVQKGAGKGGNMSQLEGKCKRTTAGEPICFNFNLRGCPNAQPGARCPRGWHLCAEPGCQKAHPLHEHRS